MPDKDQITTGGGGHTGGKFDWRSDPRARDCDAGFLEIIDELGLRIDWEKDEIVEKEVGQ